MREKAKWKARLNHGKSCKLRAIYQDDSKTKVINKEDSFISTSHKQGVGRWEGDRQNLLN